MQPDSSYSLGPTYIESYKTRKELSHILEKMNAERKALALSKLKSKKATPLPCKRAQWGDPFG